MPGVQAVIFEVAACVAENSIEPECRNEIIMRRKK